MAKQLTMMSADEFFKKALDGERDFSRIKIPEGTDMTKARGFKELQRENVELIHLEKNPFILSYSEFENIIADGLSLPYAKGTKVSFKESSLIGVSFFHVKFVHSDFSNAILRKACLYHSDLYGSYLIGANLEEADMRAIKAYDSKLIDANLKGADLGTMSGYSDLSFADLTRANLENAILTMSVLYEIDLNDAKCYGAKMNYINLENTKLIGMHLDERTVLKPSVLQYLEVKGQMQITEAMIDGVKNKILELIPQYQWGCNHL